MEKKLTAKQQKFVEVYVKNGGDHKNAALEAGYSEATALEQGCKLRKILSAQIFERSKQQIGYMVPNALSNINTLVGSSTNEMVKLKASTDILDRAGFKPVERVEDVTAKSEGADIIKLLRKDLTTLLPKLWPTLPPDIQEECLKAMGIDPLSVKKLNAEIVQLHVIEGGLAG